MYLLTNCASCAAPLSLDAPKCVRCKTRYCDASCQRDHWRRHKKDCEAMGRDGDDAEQLNAFNNCIRTSDEAVAVCHEEAVACGATCYVCQKTTNHGLIRGCSCLGTTGFAHANCLAWQAKNTIESSPSDGWTRWNTCQLCGQEYHGLVRLVMGWHCEVTYAKAEVHFHCQAMLELGIGLVAASRYEDAFAVLETLCQTLKSKTFAPPELGERFFCETLMYLAKVCNKLGWESDVLYVEESLAQFFSLVPGSPRLSGLTLLRVIFANLSATVGQSDELAHRCALELGVCMLDQNLVTEALKHLLTSHSAAERTLGGSHAVCIEMHWRTAQSIYKHHFFGGNDYRELLMASIDGYMNVLVQSTEVLGLEHPTTLGIRASLKLCLEEQLDWTLDDIPRNRIELLDKIPRPPGHKVFWK